MHYKPHPRLQSVMNKIREHKKPYEVNVLGKKIVVYPGVLSPRYNPSARFYIENIPSQKDKTVLEVGCGCGVISLLIALNGVGNIIAVDINPIAVENTVENCKMYNIDNATVLQSDLFENIDGKFDSIIFAAPYYGNKPTDLLECAVSDYNYNTLEVFLNNAKSFLKPNGSIFLGFSDTGDTDLLKKVVTENKYVITGFFEKAFSDWKAQLYVLQL